MILAEFHFGVRRSDMRQHAAQHVAHFRLPMLLGTTESVQGKKPFAVMDELKQRLLLAWRETELRIAPVSHRHDYVILGQTRRLQDGRVLADRYFQLLRVL